MVDPNPGGGRGRTRPLGSVPGGRAAGVLHQDGVPLVNTDLMSECWTDILDGERRKSHQENPQPWWEPQNPPKPVNVGPEGHF